MSLPFPSLVWGLMLLLIVGCTSQSMSAKRPIRALLVTGGCCHNYPFQTACLTNAMSRHAPVQWTLVQEGGTGTRAEIPLYTNPQWARGYDVVVHNECFADTKSPKYIRQITSAHHAGVPAVVIHCAMHTYRATEIHDWREFLGVTSRRHDHMSRYPVKKVQPNHPIVRPIPDNWVTPKDELYIIEKASPNMVPLATSTSERDAQSQPVIWVNQYGKARVFGTTYGHSDDTFADPVFIDYVCRGLLWSVGSLGN